MGQTEQGKVGEEKTVFVIEHMLMLVRKHI